MGDIPHPTQTLDKESATLQRKSLNFIIDNANILETGISHCSGVVAVTQTYPVTAISLHGASQAFGYISGGSATELALQRGFTICLILCATFDYLFSVISRLRYLAFISFPSGISHI